MRAASLRAGMLLAAILALAGCNTLGKLIPGHVDTTSLGSVRVAAPPGANLDSSTTLDLAFVYDVNAKAMMPKTATEWFAQKQSLKNGLGTSLDIESMGVPPATVVAPLKLPRKYRKAIAVYGYARYVAPAGQGRLDLTLYHAPVIWLTAAGVTVTDP